MRTALGVDPFHPYFMKLCARRGYKSAIIAVAHRLCRLLYALLRDGTGFQPTRLGVEEGPFTQTITRRFRPPRNRRDASSPPDASRIPSARPRQRLRPHVAPWAASPGNRVGPQALRNPIWGIATPNGRLATTQRDALHLRYAHQPPRTPAARLDISSS